MSEFIDYMSSLLSLTIKNVENIQMYSSHSVSGGVQTFVQYCMLGV